MRRKLMLILAAAFSLVFFAFGNGAVAEAAKTIRVALYIQAEGSYNLTVPCVTLSSPTGMTVISQTKGTAYFTVPSNQPVRFSPNHYRVLVTETEDAGSAAALAEKLVQSKVAAAATVERFGRKGKTVYRVIAGDENAYDGAAALLEKIRAELGTGLEVIGPHALHAGVFAREEEAAQRVQALLDAGFDAHLALTMGDDKKLYYMAVVGNEGTEGELNALLQEVNLAFPDLQLASLGSNRVYLIKGNDADLGGGLTGTLPHYYYSLNEKLRFRTNPGKAIRSIKVGEKGGRQYRGEMELSYHNGKLALINELPLEEYLFSVVGSEMAAGWPLEALKAQAVIARTYALGQGNKYGIANVLDSTLDQAYYGIQSEAEDVRRAVLATQGEVLTYNGKLAQALYHSNAGGLTADGQEVWGNSVSYLKPVESPDRLPEQGAPSWFRVARENGQIGYVLSDYVTMTPERNPIGLNRGTVNGENVNLRTGPSTAHGIAGSLALGEKVVILEQVKQNNAYSWVEGPVDGTALMQQLNSAASKNGFLPFTVPIQDLKVTERGPSGRVLAMTANGWPVSVKSPDSFRSVLGGLRSTKFEVEEMGRYTVLGAGGTRAEYPESRRPLYAVSAGDQVSPWLNQNSDTFVLYGQGGRLRVVSQAPMFRFHGKGYGHGLGLSQWGARALAEEGYGYAQILKHYYSDQIAIRKVE